MAFKSLQSLILTSVIKEIARANSANIRFGSSSSSNLGATKLTKPPAVNNTNEFIWGSNQGVWGKNTITIEYKP